MSNSLVDNPWVLDTAAASAIWTGKVKICSFQWTGFTTGDDVEVKDAAGRVIWAAKADSDTEPISHTGVGWITGLILSVLDAGILRVYIE